MAGSIPTPCCNCGAVEIATLYPSGLGYCRVCELEGAAFFGGCPVCHAQGGLVDVGPQEWMGCHTHKLRWLWGYGTVALINTADDSVDLTGERPVLDSAGRIGSAPHDSPG